MLKPIPPMPQVETVELPNNNSNSVADSTALVDPQAVLTLSESPQFLQAIIETLPMCLFWKDRESRYLGCNQKFAQLANLSSPEEIYGKTDYDFSCDQAEADAFCADDRETIDSGVAKLGIIKTVTHPDGTITWFESNKIPLRNINGEIIGILGTTQDITERTVSAQIIQQQADREAVLREITHKIRQSLDLPIVFETTVQKIHELLKTDRVGIFKFQSGFDFDEGEFIAESVSAGFESIAGANIATPCFGKELAWYYQRGSINAIEDIYTATVPVREMKFFAKFQVRAPLIVPLLNGPVLWGLICVQACAAPRLWQKHEIVVVEQIAEQVGIAIQQATLYQKVQSELDIRWQAEAAIGIQLRQQQALTAISQQIRNSLKVEEILATATQQVKELMAVDRVTILRLFPHGSFEVVEEAVSPAYSSMRGMSWDHRLLDPAAFEFYHQGKPRTVFDVMHDAWSLPFQGDLHVAQVKSKIVAPILLPLENDQTDNSSDIQLWGLLIVDTCSTHRHWQPAEAQLIQQIADQLAIAIHQADLFEQLQAELTERQHVEIQLRERNQELDRATRLKDEFLANMSHELRTPLNAILGMSEALQTAFSDPLSDRQRNSIVTIEKSGRHLLALINDILDLSKMEANKLTLELTDVPISKLCQNSLLFIKELAHKKQLQITTQLPEYLKQIQIRVDDLRFRQVLINLLSNAVKFTPEGGSITLDVRIVGEETDGGWDRSQRQIAFSIIDTGIGISPENIPKLFQSFVQIDSSLSRQYAGTGLGLSLVKRIIELHGGTVTVESTVDDPTVRLPQRGSCFTVSLPFDPSVEMVVPPDLPLVYPVILDPEDTITIAPKALILIVEDNDANMETMTGYLKSRGYRLVEARSGLEAIQVLIDCANEPDRDNYPNLILMDIQMPGIDGFEATRQIRLLPEFATLPIVALTALAMASDRQKCLDAGASDYVSKPVKLGQLVSKIESLLTR